MEKARRGSSTVTRRVGLINHRSKIKAVRRQMEIEILRSTIGFALLTASVRDSIQRVVGLITYTPPYSMIHGPPVCKKINPLP